MRGDPDGIDIAEPQMTNQDAIDSCFWGSCDKFNLIARQYTVFHCPSNVVSGQSQLNNVQVIASDTPEVKAITPTDDEDESKDNSD